MDLKDCTRLQKQRLSRYGCGLCEQRLDRAGCASIYGPPCSPETMAARRASCLAAYKPRARTATGGV